MCTSIIVCLGSFSSRNWIVHVPKICPKGLVIMTPGSLYRVTSSQKSFFYFFVLQLFPALLLLCHKSLLCESFLIVHVYLWPGLAGVHKLNIIRQGFSNFSPSCSNFCPTVNFTNTIRAAFCLFSFAKKLIIQSICKQRKVTPNS